MDAALKLKWRKSPEDSDTRRRRENLQSLLNDMVEFVVDNNIVSSVDIKSLDSVRPDAMDSFYNVWQKRERKAGKTKVRQICEVKNNNLRYIHTSIATYVPFRSHSNVFSYRKNLGCVNCATPHVGSFALFKIDIKDFFPSITRSMIEHVVERELRDFDCVRNDAFQIFVRLVAICCTRTNPSQPKDAPVAALPIGIAPAGAISNAVLYDFDEKMSSLPGITYTRYSDNVFVSSKESHIPVDVRQEIIRMINQFTIAGLQPFKVNESKTRYVTRARHQRVLGIVVNEKVNVPKRKVNYLRSAVAHLVKDSLSALQNSDVDRVPHLRKRLKKCEGYISYFSSINREKMARYRSQLSIAKMALDCIKTAKEEVQE